MGIVLLLIVAALCVLSGTVVGHVFDASPWRDQAFLACSIFTLVPFGTLLFLVGLAAEGED